MNKKTHQKISKALGANRIIQVSTPTGLNYWYKRYKEMNSITKCLFFADAITLHIRCNDKVMEILKRLCLMACTQCDEMGKNKYHSNLKIVINSQKDLDRIIPTMKKNFINDRHLEDDYIEQMREMFEEL